MGLPEDLSRPAVKLARRLQALATGRVYLLILVKLPGRWLWSVFPNTAGVKIEGVDGEKE